MANVPIADHSQCVPCAGGDVPAKGRQLGLTPIVHRTIEARPGTGRNESHFVHGSTAAWQRVP